MRNHRVHKGLDAAGGQNRGRHASGKVGEEAASTSPRLTRVATSLACVLTLARIALAYKLPVTPNTAAQFDDWLFIDHAFSFLSGAWMGAYGNNTLVKNPGFALALALFKGLGLRYQLGIILLHVLTCLLVARSLRPLVPSRAIRCALYVLLLYMPSLFTYVYFQRVYRNGIVIPLTLGLFACFVALYLRRQDKALRLVPWALCAGAFLGLFSVMQESASWALPFVLVCTLVTLILTLFDVRGQAKYARQGATMPAALGKGAVVAKVLVLLAPLAALVLTQVAVERINDRVYGVPIMNEKYGGSFARATGDLMRIDVGYADRHVWVSREALDRAYGVSPSLRQIEGQIDQAMTQWATDGLSARLLEGMEGQQTRGQVVGDLVYWALRDAYAAAGGYANAPQTEEFWAAVARELEAGFDAGTLAKKDGLYLSYTIEPLPKDGVVNWIKTTAGIMGSYAGATVMDEASIQPLDATVVGDGPMELQLQARELLGSNTLLGSGGKPVEDDVVTQRCGVWIEANRAVYGVLRVVRLVLVVACVPLTLLLLVDDLRRRDRNGARTALVVAGFALSAFVLVFAASWMVAYTVESYGYGPEVARAAYSYCGGFHALLALVLCVVVGRSLQRLEDLITGP